MKAIRFLLLILVGSSFFWGSTSRSDSTSANEIIEEIRDLYATTTRIEADSVTSRIKLMQVLNDSSFGPWIKFSTDSNYVNVATIYLVDSRVVSAGLSFFSHSGDWASYNNYYFRADGSIAFVYSELRTFFGEAQVEQRFYFDSGGHIVRKLRSVCDLFTGEKVDRDYMGRAPEIYMSVGQLVKAFGRENIYGTEGNDPKSSGKSDKTN